MKIFRFLTFSLCALLLLSGCDYLSGFKEVRISQTRISKVCDKKHKLKYPEIVPAYTSWINSTGWDIEFLRQANWNL
jgi:hypothetical protein